MMDLQDLDCFFFQIWIKNREIKAPRTDRLVVAATGYIVQMYAQQRAGIGIKIVTVTDKPQFLHYLGVACIVPVTDISFFKSSKDQADLFEGRYLAVIDAGFDPQKNPLLYSVGIKLIQAFKQTGKIRLDLIFALLDNLFF